MLLAYLAYHGLCGIMRTRSFLQTSENYEYPRSRNYNPRGYDLWNNQVGVHSPISYCARTKLTQHKRGKATGYSPAPGDSTRVAHLGKLLSLNQK